MQRWGLTLAFLFNLIETESLLCIMNPFQCHMSWSMCGLVTFSRFNICIWKSSKKNNIRYWNPSDKRTWSQISPLKYDVIFSLFFFFCWNVVDLPCYVHLCCTAKCLSYPYTYVYIHDSFSYSFPSWFITGYCCLSVLYVMVYTFSSPTPMPSLPTPPPLGNKPALRLWVYFYFIDKFTSIIFEISGVRDIIWYLHFCVWLTVSQYDNLEVHPSFIFFSTVYIKRCRIRFLLLYSRTFF